MNSRVEDKKFVVTKVDIMELENEHEVINRKVEKVS
jgi:hypothetical protein